MTFETERLVLRPWQESDREPFAQLNSDKRVMEFFPTVRTREESDWMLDECNRRIARDGFCFWAVDKKDNDEFIGFVGLNTFEADLPFCPCVEIGWRLAFDHWGQGIATEAALKSLELGFDKFMLDEIVSFTALSNVRSRRVMERIGMVDTGETFFHPQIEEGHVLQEHCLYRIRSTEFGSCPVR